MARYFKNKVLLKPRGSSVILFALNCRRQYHSALAEYHCEAIPLAERNEANKTARLPYEKSRNPQAFFFITNCLFIWFLRCLRQRRRHLRHQRLLR